jgi:hypothetical protein
VTRCLADTGFGEAQIDSTCASVSLGRVAGDLQEGTPVTGV